MKNVLPHAGHKGSFFQETVTFRVKKPQVQSRVGVFCHSVGIRTSQTDSGHLVKDVVQISTESQKAVALEFGDKRLSMLLNLAFSCAKQR